MKKVNFSKQFLIILSLIIILSLTIILLTNRSVVLGLFSPKQSTNSIELNISSQYESYLLNQTIWLKVTLVNNTSKPYHLKSPLDIFGVNLKIIKPDKSIVPKGFWSEGSLMVFDSLYLSVNDSLIGYFNLDFFMKNGNIISENFTGSFKIIGSYQEIKSNEITISILYPTGDDKELFDQTFGAFYPFSNNDQSRKLESLLDKYDHSPYAPQLYEQLFVFSPDKSDTNRFLRNFESYFNNNFDDFGTINIINEYKTYLQYVMRLSENDINYKMEMLKNKYPDTFVEACIRENNFEIQKKKF